MEEALNLSSDRLLDDDEAAEKSVTNIFKVRTQLFARTRPLKQFLN